LVEQGKAEVEKARNDGLTSLEVVKHFKNEEVVNYLMLNTGVRRIKEVSE